MKKIFCLFFVLGLSGCFNHKEAAEKQATIYANKMIPGFKAIDCVNQDSDNDGYFSCSVLDSKDQLIRIECIGRNFGFSEGCKIPISYGSVAE